MQKREKHSGINGGRTRTRTWDPLIKRTRVLIVRDMQQWWGSCRSALEIGIRLGILSVCREQEYEGTVFP
jgi:hypothetical protein